MKHGYGKLEANPVSIQDSGWIRVGYARIRVSEKLIFGYVLDTSESVLDTYESVLDTGWIHPKIET